MKQLCHILELCFWASSHSVMPKNTLHRRSATSLETESALVLYKQRLILISQFESPNSFIQNCETTGEHDSRSVKSLCTELD